MRSPICRTVAHIAPGPGTIVKLFTTGVTRNHKTFKMDQPQRISAKPMSQTSKTKFLARQFWISCDIFQIKASCFVDYQHFQHFGVSKLGNLVKKPNNFCALAKCCKSLLEKYLKNLYLNPALSLKALRRQRLQVRLLSGALPDPLKTSQLRRVF